MKFCSMMYRYSYIDRYSVKPRLLNLSWILNRKAKNVALAGRNIPLLIIWVFALYQLQLATKRNVVGAKSDIEILFEEVPFTLCLRSRSREQEREKKEFLPRVFCRRPTKHSRAGSCNLRENETVGKILLSANKETDRPHNCAFSLCL